MASYRNLEEAEAPSVMDFQKTSSGESLVMENHDLHPDIYISNSYLFVSYATKIFAWMGVFYGVAMGFLVPVMYTYSVLTDSTLVEYVLIMLGTLFLFYSLFLFVSGLFGVYSTSEGKSQQIYCLLYTVSQIVLALFHVLVFLFCLVVLPLIYVFEYKNQYIFIENFKIAAYVPVIILPIQFLIASVISVASILFSVANNSFVTKETIAIFKGGIPYV